MERARRFGDDDALTPTYAEKLVDIQRQEMTYGEKIAAAQAAYAQELQTRFDAEKISQAELRSEGEQLHQKTPEALIQEAEHAARADRNKALDVQRFTAEITQEQYIQGRRDTATMSLAALNTDARNRSRPSEASHERKEAEREPAHPAAQAPDLARYAATRTPGREAGRYDELKAPHEEHERLTQTQRAREQEEGRQREDRKSETTAERGERLSRETRTSGRELTAQERRQQALTEARERAAQTNARTLDGGRGRERERE